MSPSFDAIDGFGLDTEMGFFIPGESPAFLGDLRADVETDFSVLVVRSGITGSRTGDACLCWSPRLGMLNWAPAMVSFP